MASQFPFSTVITSTTNISNGPLGSTSKNSAYFTSNNGSLLGAHTSMHVTGPAKFDETILLKGKDLGNILETIEKRLLILVPNLKKLAKYEALQKAYDHYLLLEKLCFDDDDNK